MTTTDQRWNPAIERARLMKACEIEEIAVEGGVSAADLSSEDVRENLRKLLAAKRGKRPSQVSVSIDTWRVVWRLLHDRETRGTDHWGADPFANLPGGGR
jgi:hypothetical protein